MAKEKEILNRVDSGYKGELSEFNDLQPIDLKLPMYSEVTKASIIKRGFVQPFAMCSIDGKLYILDGHLRHDLINELINDGYKVPTMFSYFLVDVDNNRKTAVDTLMSFNVKANPIDRNVLVEYAEVEEVVVVIEEMNVFVEVVEIGDDTDIDFDNIEGNQDRDNAKNSKSVTCPNCEHNFFA